MVSFVLFILRYIERYGIDTEGSSEWRKWGRRSGSAVRPAAEVALLNAFQGLVKKGSSHSLTSEIEIWIHNGVIKNKFRNFTFKSPITSSFLFFRALPLTTSDYPLMQHLSMLNSNLRRPRKTTGSKHPIILFNINQRRPRNPHRSPRTRPSTRPRERNRPKIRKRN